MIRNTTKDNGTIWVAKQSHKEGIAKQNWIEINGRATQIIVDPFIIDKYEEIQLEMEVGDVLFFDGKLDSL
jgi:ectoine hydroxylase-related dioxygenase (phytanoyl-CoA dioxygenase family)